MFYRILVIMVVGAILCTTSITAGAEGWRSSLYPEDWTPSFTDSEGRFLHDFSYAGYHRGEKPLPTATCGQCFNVTHPPYNADPTGKESATLAIQNAINDAGRAGGGTVFIPSGTYRITYASPRVSAALLVGHSNVVIRGSGPDQTFLFLDETVTRGKAVIRVEPLLGMSWLRPRDSNVSRIRADLKPRDTVIPLDGTPPYSPGEWVVIQFDVTSDWIAEHNMSDGWDTTVTGPSFYRQVMAVDTINNTITVDTPVRYDVKMRDNGRVYRVADPLEEVGLTGFSIGMREHPGRSGWGVNDYSRVGTSAYEVHASTTISFNGVINSWMTNVSTYKPEGNQTAHIHSQGFTFRQSRFLTIRDVFVENPQYRGAGGNGYPIVIGTQESLYDNIRAVNGRHNFTITNMRASGNVIYRGIISNPVGHLVADFHAHLSMANLIDNLTLKEDACDAMDRSPYPSTSQRKHGVTTTQTVFWNNVGVAYGQHEAIIRSDQFGWGYVIGTRGPAPRVTIIEGNPRTAPDDFLEGEGQGAKLEPQSLYFDQLQRRLLREGKEDVWKSVRDDLTPPPVDQWGEYEDDDNNGDDNGNGGVGTCFIEIGDSNRDLVVNGNFEQGLAGWAVGSRDVTVEEGIMTIRSVSGDDRYALNQTVRDIQIGKEYVLLADIRTLGALETPRGAGSAVYVRLRAAGRSGNTHPLVHTDRVTNTEGWHKLCASITIPQETTRLHLEIFSEYVKGTVQLRNIRLIEL